MPSEKRSYLHCKQCVLGRQTQRLEVSVSERGLYVDCKKHGPVATFDPQRLADMMARAGECEFCALGQPHDHNEGR